MASWQTPLDGKKAKPTIATSLYALDIEELRAVLLGLIQQGTLSLSEAQAQQILSANKATKNL